MTAKVVKPTDVIVLDLDTPYTVERVFGQTGDRQAGLKYERRWEDLDLVRGEKADGRRFRNIDQLFRNTARRTAAAMDRRCDLDKNAQRRRLGIGRFAERRSRPAIPGKRPSFGQGVDRHHCTVPDPLVAFSARVN